MIKLLKTVTNLFIKVSIFSLMVGLLILISFYTPLFSSVGLWTLNHLPIPKIENNSNQVLVPSAENNNVFDTSQNKANGSASKNNLSLDLQFNHDPTAYVVLGGGLTQAENQSSAEKINSKLDNNERQIKSSISAGYNAGKSSDNQNEHVSRSSLYKPKANKIILNEYSLIRMQTVLKHHQKKPLPILLTGVEAAWMKEWLNNYGIYNIVTENASMNTCENARFTAKRLNIQKVFLVTDAYHMTRARRQFALNGIQTYPIPAALPLTKGWLAPANNAQHSRRTLYELAAYFRDVLLPQKNCRNADDVSFEALLRSRKPNSVKTF